MNLWRGMNMQTGRWITDLDHVRQSTRVCLLTPIGSRVQRRGFGSLIPELIDRPFNGVTRLQLMGAAAISLPEHEPRLQLSEVLFVTPEDGGQAGGASVEIAGVLVTTGENVELSTAVTS